MRIANSAVMNLAVVPPSVNPAAGALVGRETTDVLLLMARQLPGLALALVRSPDPAMYWKENINRVVGEQNGVTL